MTKVSNYGVRATVLMAGTMLSGVAMAQTTPTAPAAQAQQAAPATTPPVVVSAPVRNIRSLTVRGSQRIEPDTVLSYTKLRVGQPYTTESLDQAIVDLLASDLLADAQIEGVETGDIVVVVRENPIINRVVLEGNKRLKDDKIVKEIKLAPRQIFTRTAVRADVARIVELYRRQGRFAASVEPQMVMLDQNRVDVVFEINEGPKSKVRQINIIGNDQYSDSDLRKEMYTKQARTFRIFSSNTSYDQDRLAADQQKLRQFYLTEGYADFRVISAVAELTPDKRDFIITYVVEEGPRYKFGDVKVDSAIRDFDGEKLAATLPMKKGDWYNAKLVEDSIDSLSQYAGLYGYAFTDVRPEFQRDREALTMGINFFLAEANRTYVERVEITGNTQTQDKVIRREMRVAEGDAFNAFMVKRSQDRINSLGYFQDKFEIKQEQGSTPDRIILAANVEERSTGELSLSAGFSSLEKFILQASIRQNNFRGKGQTLSASASYSSYSKSIELGFTEPYLFDKNIALGGTLFRRDYNSFNYYGSGRDRNDLYSQLSTGGTLVAGVPLTEYWQLSGRYTLQQDKVTLDEDTYYTNGECDPLKAGRYLCDAIGNRLTSSIGLSLIYDSLNSRLRPSRGSRVVLGTDFAGLGGDVRYIRGRFDGDKYWNLGGWVLSAGLEGGYIHALQDSPGPGIDPVRITDRFYLGEPQFRGFDIRGVGPRIRRTYMTGDAASGTQALTTDNSYDDPLGGKAYYLGKLELEPPLGSGISELGLRPSVFVQIGSLFSLTRPRPTAEFEQATDASGNPMFNKDGSPSLLPRVDPIRTDTGQALYLNSFTNSSGSTSTRLTTCTTGYSATYGGTCVGGETNVAAVNTVAPFLEEYYGDTWKPRLSVGIGVNWNSPFGPLRIDVAKALLKQKGDDTKLITFNVGTQF